MHGNPSDGRGPLLKRAPLGTEKNPNGIPAGMSHPSRFFRPLQADSAFVEFMFPAHAIMWFTALKNVQGVRK